VPLAIWLAAVRVTGARPGEPVAAALVTSLWRDDPADRSRVVVDELPGIIEPSDLLLKDGELYTISDDQRQIFRVRFDGPRGAPRRAGSWTPSGLPQAVDLEALAPLPGGGVLLASETRGVLFVIQPFPDHACAAWNTEVDGSCFIGKPNCGVEALALLPGDRLFVAKERDPRGAWLFDLPADPCRGTTLAGRTYLTLPEEVGPDISAATFDGPSGHLLVVARARQSVLEFEVPAATPGDTSPRPLRLLGSFSYARSENSLDYAGLDFHQVEGIAVDDARTLYLSVDNNDRFSRSFGNRHAALLRFFPQALPPN
jgi:hypothetical protein